MSAKPKRRTKPGTRAHKPQKPKIARKRVVPPKKPDKAPIAEKKEEEITRRQPKYSP